MDDRDRVGFLHALTGSDFAFVRDGARAQLAAFQKGNAQPLIDWFEAGADGQIDWGQPGDFEQCVDVASAHLDDPEGFCFAGETEILTRDGVAPIGDLAGSTQHVLTHAAPSGRAQPVNLGGHWAEAPVRAFGEQRLVRVTLTRKGQRKVVRATPEHVWFASRDARNNQRLYLNDVRTDALEPGMVLASLAPRRLTDATRPSPFGVAAGFVYGDGHRTPNRGCIVDVWNGKDEALLPYFARCPWTPTKEHASGLLGTRVTGIPSSWKDRPSLDEGPTYLLGWLAGYFAADGTVDERGGATLYSADRASLEFVRTVANRVGIATYPIHAYERLGFGSEPSPLFAVGLAARTVTPEFFVIPQHRCRAEEAATRPGVQLPLRWRIESVEDRGEAEEVFCAVVPNTATFALADYVWVHNCQERHIAVTGEPAGKGAHGGSG
jgi:DNA primase